MKTAFIINPWWNDHRCYMYHLIPSWLRDSDSLSGINTDKQIKDIVIIQLILLKCSQVNREELTLTVIHIIGLKCQNCHISLKLIMFNLLEIKDFFSIHVQSNQQTITVSQCYQNSVRKFKIHLKFFLFWFEEKRKTTQNFYSK